MSHHIFTVSLYLSLSLYLTLYLAIFFSLILFTTALVKSLIIQHCINIIHLFINIFIITSHQNFQFFFFSIVSVRSLMIQPYPLSRTQKQSAYCSKQTTQIKNKIMKIMNKIINKTVKIMKQIMDKITKIMK